MNSDNRGAFGSNQPLERVPYVPEGSTSEPDETEKLEVLASSAAHPVSEKLEVLQQPPEVKKPALSATEDEPVYLREDLRPRR